MWTIINFTVMINVLINFNMLSTYLVYVTERINSFGVTGALQVELILTGQAVQVFLPWEVSFDIVK